MNTPPFQVSTHARIRAHIPEIPYFFRAVLKTTFVTNAPCIKIIMIIMIYYSDGQNTLQKEVGKQRLS